MRSLYKLLVFDTLRRSAGSHRDDVAEAIADRGWSCSKQDFSRQSQRGALRRYVTGLLSDSRRKSMEAMWARLSDPGTYQAFQHFITHAPWDAERVWKRLRAVVPERTGRPDSRRHELSRNRARPRSASRGSTAARAARSRIARRRSPSALWTGHAGVAAGRDAVSARGVADAAPARRGRRFRRRCDSQPKWQLGLTLLRQVRAAGFTVTAVVGDAEFGDNATLRRTLHRAQLPYALGVSSDLKVFLGTPRARGAAAADRQRAPAHAPPVAARHAHRRSARAGRPTQPPRQWRLVSWRNGTNPPVARPLLCGPRHARARLARATTRARSLVALRARSGERRPHDQATTWWICRPPRRCAPWSRLAHQRWAIEQQYQELKDEIGLDHFEGRSLPGWQRHVVLTAIAYSFLQNERRRRGQTHLTLPRVRAVIQEVLTAHFFMTQPHYLKWMLKLKDVEMRN